MTVGNREIVHTATLIIPEGEDARIELKIGSWRPRLTIVFEDKSEEASTIKIDRDGSHGRMTFINWKNSLGTATLRPVEVGKTNDGKTLLLMASQRRIGVVNCLHLQFMLGGVS